MDERERNERLHATAPSCQETLAHKPKLIDNPEELITQALYQLTDSVEALRDAPIPPDPPERSETLTKDPE